MLLHPFLPHWKHLKLTSQNYGLEKNLTPWNYFYILSLNWVIYSLIFMKSTLPRSYGCDSRHLILALTCLTFVPRSNITNQSSYRFPWSGSSSEFFSTPDSTATITWPNLIFYAGCKAPDSYNIPRFFLFPLQQYIAPNNCDLINRKVLET